MNQPSLDELLKKGDSRYTLVIVAAKRARDLIENGSAKNGVDKPVTTALKEIVVDKIKYKRYKKRIK